VFCCRPPSLSRPPAPPPALPLLPISQVHYDNPEGLTGVVDDSSSVLLHFTDVPREQEAGTINIGDPNVVLFGQTVESGRNYTIRCPAECTSQLAQPLTVYNSMLHAHRTALYLFTNQFRNGTFLRTLEGTRFWYVWPTSGGRRRASGLFSECCGGGGGPAAAALGWVAAAVCAFPLRVR